MNYSSFSDPAQTESRLLENVHQYSIDVVNVGLKASKRLVLVHLKLSNIR